MSKPLSDVQNLLLRLLTQEGLKALIARAELVELHLGEVLLRPDERVAHVHFVESGTVSMVSTLLDGSRVEVGIIGSEGMVGLSHVLGAATSPLEGLVQVSGEAYRLTTAAFDCHLAVMPGLSKTLLRYIDSFYSQVIQTAVCNGRHKVEQRLARWLLITHDRVDGDTFPMTQEFLATMLGARRQGISEALRALKGTGAVLHVPGTVTVTDRQMLEGLACECYAHARARMDWLYAPNG